MPINFLKINTSKCFALYPSYGGCVSCFVENWIFFISVLSFKRFIYLIVSVAVICGGVLIPTNAYFELSSSNELWEGNYICRAQWILFCLEPLVLSHFISSTLKVMNNFITAIHPGSHLVIDFLNDDSDHIAIDYIAIAPCK